MTKDDAFEIIKPIFSAAYRAGAAGLPYPLADKQTFVNFYTEQTGLQPSTFILEFYARADSLCRQAYQRGQNSSR